MRHSGIVNLNKSNFFKTITKNNVVIFMALFYIIGIVVGVISLANSDAVLAFAAADFESFLNIRSGSEFTRIFISSFLGILPFALLVFICGTSLVGVALTPLALVFRGFEYGVLSGFLYKELSLQGIAFNSLILIPTTLVCVFGFLFAGKQAFNFSLHLARISMPKGQTTGVYNDFKTYCKHFLLSLIFFVIAALLDAVMCVSFIKFFEF